MAAMASEAHRCRPARHHSNELHDARAANDAAGRCRSRRHRKYEGSGVSRARRAPHLSRAPGRRRRHVGTACARTVGCRKDALHRHVRDDGVWGRGWPRHIIRVLSAFFFGASAPIKRLSVSAEDRDMPVDFLEAWATSLWALGFVEKTLQSKKSLSEFAKPIPKLRAAIISGISLTQAELDSATMRGVKERLDEGIGARLSSAFPSPLPRDGSWRVAARNAGTETPLQVGQR